MADSTVQGNIVIDIKAASNLSPELKAEFDRLRQSLLNANNTAKDTQDILLQMKDILDQDTQSASNFADATDKIKSGMESAASGAKLASEASTDLTDQFKGLTSGLNDAYGVIRKVAYALPGIGIAGIFGLLGEGIVKLISAFGSLNEVEEATIKVNDEVTKKFSEEAGQVQVLTATLLDHNTTKTEQKKIIDQLIDQHPNYFNNLKDEKDLTEKVTDDVNKFTKALEEEARVKAVSAEITKLVAQQLEIEIDYKEELDKWNRQILADQESGNKDAIDLDNQSILYARQNANTRIDEIQKQIDAYKMLGVTAEQNLAKLGGSTGKDNNGKKDNSLQEQANYIAESQKILEDAEQKEITSENIKYEKIKKDLQEFNHSTEELTAQHEQNIADIHQKFELQRIQEIQKAFDAINRKQIDEADKGAQKLTDAIQAHYDRQAEIGKTAEQKQIDEENAFYNKAIENLMLFGGSTLDLEIKHQEALAAIKQEYEDKAAAKDATRRANELQRDGKHVNSIIGQKKSQYANEKTLLDNYEQNVKIAYSKSEITVQQYTQDLESIAKARSEILSKEIANYADYAGGIGDNLTKIGEAFGENTQVGKELAIAGTVISTIASAVKSYEAMAEIPVVGPALGFAAAAAALASGYANVKKIEAVQIPGQGGGGSSVSTAALGGGAANYSAPQIAQAVNYTSLSPQAVGQIQSVAQPYQNTRFYVLESDITDTQGQVRGYVRSNRIG
jgi:hypothetical protein